MEDVDLLSWGVVEARHGQAGKEEKSFHVLGEHVVFITVMIEQVYREFDALEDVQVFQASHPRQRCVVKIEMTICSCQHEPVFCFALQLTWPFVLLIACALSSYLISQWMSYFSPNFLFEILNLKLAAQSIKTQYLTD